MPEIHRQSSADPICVIGLCGSLRAGSYTRRAVELALAGAAEAGARTELVDLETFDLPFCIGDNDAYAGHAGVAALRRAVRGAQGAIWGTPEYHGSLSGVLKNALDLTDIEDWRGKVLGLVGISGGSTGPTSAINAMRHVGRGLDAWVLPRQVAIAAAHKAFDDQGEPLADQLRQRLVKLGRETARFARLHAYHAH